MGFQITMQVRGLLATVILLFPLAVLAAVPPTAPRDASLTPVTAVAPAAVAVPGNLVVNGDFESSSLAPGCWWNLENAPVTAGLAGITAWGPAAEIDYVNNGTGCEYISLPHQGQAQLGIHLQDESFFGDGFCFELTAPVHAGEAYVLSFFVMANTSFEVGIGAVEVGLSNDAASFGTLLVSAAGNTAEWTYVEHEFVAAQDADFLCVQPAAGVPAWNLLDDFSLVSNVVPADSHSWGTVYGMYR